MISIKSGFWGLIVLLLQGCYFGNNPILYEQDLPGGLLLFAMDDMKNLTVWEQSDVNKESVIGIVNPTVFEIGWTDDFIIAKTHPKLLSLVKNRRPPAQVYITKTDFIAISDSSYVIYRWIETPSDPEASDPCELNGNKGKTLSRLFEIPKDSIASFKQITYWHVIDIKKDKKHYLMNSMEQFLFQKKKLGIPDSLTFFLNFEELK